MTKPELKPCPFCGGSVSIGISDEGTTGAIECAKGSSCIGSGLLIGFMKADQETAIAAWNTRAIDPAADRIEQLLESIKNLSHLWATAAVNREVSEGKLAECLEQNALLEARLSKAVEALREMLEDPEYWSPYARATLAGLEKPE